nr:hypothetical protein [Mucilaginibacter kameinonensis]
MATTKAMERTSKRSGNANAKNCLNKQNDYFKASVGDKHSNQKSNNGWDTHKCSLRVSFAEVHAHKNNVSGH